MIAPGVIRCMAWRAVAPGMTTIDDWRRFLDGEVPVPLNDTGFRPALEKVPPMMRRRLTPLTRLVMASWYDACEAAGIDVSAHPIVFASRHGEIAILETLLSAMERHLPLSPTDFCHSVHHTPTGYMSMAADHRGISRTVSAGNETVAAGLIEVWSLLQAKMATCVVLCIADEPVHEVFTNSPVAPSFGHAATFVFREDREDARLPERRDFRKLDLSLPDRSISLMELMKEL